MAKRRGNPNWGKPEPPPVSEPSSFEKLVKSLRLAPHQYLGSCALREWVQKNKDHKYVPLDVLEAFGLDVAADN